MAGDYLTGIDLYEQLAEMCTDQSVEILAELYDHYMTLPHGKNRYSLYVSRHFQFDIRPGDKVLDIGSGHDPFPLATHLADITEHDHHYGRAGVALKKIEGKPFFECGVESTPFADKEFDFVYCSHVLEHSLDPEKACRELMRIGKRGYIETPTRGKDLWMNSAEISNHLWAVENWEGKLIFTEYTPEAKRGFANDIIMNMHCSPQTPREKALAALIWLKAPVVNTMLYWEDTIDFEVRRHKAQG